MRSSASISIAALIVLFDTALASADCTIVVGERIPAVMLVVLPKEALSATPSSEFLAAAAAAFDRRTGFSLRSLEQAGFDADRLARCDRRTRLSCWVSEVRTTRVLLVVTVLPFEPGRDRLSTMLIETARALACFDEIDPKLDDAAQKVEDCIYERALRSAPSVIETKDRTRLAAYFDDLVTGDFMPRIREMGMLDPFGRIALSTDAPGSEIALDENTIGKTATGVTRLIDVAPGRRALRVRGASGASTELAVAVRSGATSSVTAHLEAPFEPPQGAARAILLFSGAGAAVAGGLLAAISIHDSASVHTRCFVPAGSSGAQCTAVGVPTFGFHGAAVPTFDRSAVNPRGVPILGLAVALIAAGALAIAATFVFDP